MTNYEKFLKGDILPYKGQLLKLRKEAFYYRYPHKESEIIIFTYRLSVYKNAYYILVSTCKKIMNYGKFCFSHGLEYVIESYRGIGGYIYINIPNLVETSGMWNYFVLRRDTLERLTFFLQNPELYIHQKEKYGISKRIFKR